MYFAKMHEYDRRRLSHRTAWTCRKRRSSSYATAFIPLETICLSVYFTFTAKLNICNFVAFAF